MVLPPINKVINLQKKTSNSLPRIYPEPPESGRVLVLSPHFDDETIGCGGTLFKHSRRGDEIKILFLTDGTKGTTDLHRDLELNEIRKRETENACSTLGIKNKVFWDIDETVFKCDGSTIKKTIALLKDFQPDVILLPSILESHQHHVETNKILANSLRKTKITTSINMFEIWTPVPINHLIDISDVFDKKREALLKYESQLKIIGYLKGIEGLNSYRATITARGNLMKHAEGFIHCDTEEYLKICSIV